MNFLRSSMITLNLIRRILNKTDVLVISIMLEHENDIICSQYIIIMKIIVGLSFHSQDHCQNIRLKYHTVSRFHHQFLRNCHLCSWNNFVACTCRYTSLHSLYKHKTFHYIHWNTDMTSVQVLHLVPVDSSSTVLRASHLLFSIRDHLDLGLMRSSLKISAIKLLDSLLELCATANNQDMEVSYLIH